MNGLESYHDKYDGFKIWELESFVIVRDVAEIFEKAFALTFNF